MMTLLNPVGAVHSRHNLPIYRQPQNGNALPNTSNIYRQTLNRSLKFIGDPRQGLSICE